MTNRKIGIADDMSQALIDWLETHHIRGKDVFAWSAVAQDEDITRMTISFYVTGVDMLPWPPDTRPDADIRNPDRTVDIPTDTPGQGDRDWAGNWAVPDRDTLYTPLVTSDPGAVTEQMSAVPPYNPDETRPYVRRPIRDNPQA